MAINFELTKDNDNVAAFSPTDPITEKVDKSIVISVVGCSSTIYKECKRRATDQVLQKAQKNAKKLTTAQSLEDQTIDRLARCIKGWTGIETPFSYDAAVALLTEQSWLAEQIGDFIEDRANFLGNSQQS